MSKACHSATGGSASGGKNSAFCLLPSASVPFRRGFTLLELLVVIAIIAILTGMIIPTFYYAKQRAREAKARVTVKQLETAFKAYLDTYKVWPSVFADGEIAADIFRVLRGEYVADANKDKIAFYEFESSTNSAITAAYDSWSNPNDSSTWKPYKVMFDMNYDNKIDANQDIYRSVVVYSVGEDRNDNNGGGDDVASWK
ncbi:MAG: type II secretion system protein [Kiritimatiellia bacterium]|nr:type II secretion system protein [Kiritimatiellia bacterium]